MIQPFDLDEANVLGDRSVVLVLGKRASGKTHIVTDWVASRELTHSLVMTSNDRRAYETRGVPADAVYDAWTPDAVQELLATRRYLVRAGEVLSPCVVVLDDVLLDTTACGSVALFDLLSNGWAYDITVLVTRQCLPNFPKHLQRVVDFVVVCDAKADPLVWKTYVPEIPAAVLDECLAEHGRLVLDIRPIDDAITAERCVYAMGRKPEKRTQYLVDKETTEFMYNLMFYKTPVDEMPDELKRYATGRDERTAWLRGGESMRASHEFMEWSVAGYAKDDLTVPLWWHEPVNIRLPREYWGYRGNGTRMT